MAITRLSGGTTPANGSDPRTFPAIWNDAADDIEAAESAISAIEANDWVTTARIDDGAVTAPKLANTAGAVMVFDDDTARTTAIPTPSEGMVTYLKDTNLVEAYTGAAFEAVSQPGILQVVSTTKTDASYSISLAGGAVAAANITDLEVTITPTSTSSKILVFATVLYSTSVAASKSIILYRDATAIAIGDSAGSRTRVSGTGTIRATSDVAPIIAQHLDTPATTSAITYGVRIHNTNSADTVSVFVNRSDRDNDFNYEVRGVSTITVMEVAG